MYGFITYIHICVYTVYGVLRVHMYSEYNLMVTVSAWTYKQKPCGPFFITVRIYYFYMEHGPIIFTVRDTEYVAKHHFV